MIFGLSGMVPATIIVGSLPSIVELWNILEKVLRWLDSRVFRLAWCPIIEVEAAAAVVGHSSDSG
ncbi:Protein of unknown function [Pyronema omphalodes CBS 100304]|uniref:Uncharacterized protein n=1 Tax=Pyronema omphalodes (strain CBS 100304) TaxID=1076935 RepID=U4LS95_PYROM|nr:Protein of unknown function [Pyronema omphalodes CBS 100304]